MRHLALPTTRELEDVVISAVYAGLLTAKLNPLRQEVQVSSVAPLRDVRPASIAGIVNTLQEWSARCDATLAELEASVSAIRAEAARSAERKRESERVVAAAIAAEEKNASGGVEGGAGAGSGSANTRHKQRKGYGNAAVAHLKSQIVSGGGGGGGGSGVSGAGANSGSKRGSEKLMESTAGTEEDDEAMDVDDDGEVPGQKRASRRKL